MQNLVSKNPVLRFKLGKKIIKAQKGLLFIYYKGRDGKDYEAWRGGNDWYYRQKGTTGMTRMPYNYITTTGLKFYNSTSKGAVANTYDVVNNMSNQPKEHIPLGEVLAMRLKYLGKSNIDVAKEEIHNYLEGLRNKYVRPFKNNSLTKTITPVNNYYLKGFENRKAELAQQGKTVRDIQKMLGFTGKDLDGKWGQNTEDAYLQYLALKNVPIYEKTPEQTIDISSPSKVLNSTVVNLEPVTTDLIIANNNIPTVENEGEKYFARNGNYNKSQIRELMRQKGLNPYSFSGSDRKAIRLWLNGETDDWGRLAFKNSRLYDAFVRPYGYKQGGQLVSRNPVKRFKNKKK